MRKCNMRDWKNTCKKIGNKLLFPPVWLVFFLAVVSIVGLVTVFVKLWEKEPIAYILYVLSFYTLLVITRVCIVVFPGYFRSWKAKIEAHQYGYRYLHDAAFRTQVLLKLSFTANLLYVLLNFFSVFLFRSAWFGILAGYYMILAGMRFLLMRYASKKGIGKDFLGELHRSRICAIILMTVNLVLSGAVLMILYQDKGYVYKGMLIYVVAAYTFYITVHSVVELVKYRKYNSPIMSTTKVINLSAALVSVLTLETAMLSQFGADTTDAFRRIMIGATGGGVSIVIVTLSLYMILRANREIKKIKA